MITLRRIAELVSRGRMITRRTLPQFGGRKITVSPDASLRWLRHDPWRDENDLIDAIEVLGQEGAVCWDIGANVGAFGLSIADRTRAPLVMIEGDPFLAKCLNASAADNPDLTVEIICCAIADKPGIGRFAIAGRGRSTNGLVDGKISTQHGESRAITPVPLLTADILLDNYSAPDIVKIDVEGGEAMLIEGAKRLIDEVRPVFYIEVHRDNRPQVLGRFADAGYELRQRRNRNWIEVQNPPSSEDFFAIPREKAAAILQ